MAKHQFSRASRFFVHFFAVVARLLREIARFEENVNARQGPFFSLNFKDVLDFEFLCDVNQTLKVRCLLSRPLRKQKFTTTGSKGHGL